MSIVLAIVGLGLLIVLHEGGHFVVARLCGMRVERFSIGFGPTLIGFKRGDTTFQIYRVPRPRMTSPVSWPSKSTAGRS